MSDWLQISKAQARLVQWCGPEELVLNSDTGLVKVAKASLLDAMKAATYDLFRVSGVDIAELLELDAAVGSGFLRLQAKTIDGQTWCGFAGIHVLASA